MIEKAKSFYKDYFPYIYELQDIRVAGFVVFGVIVLLMKNKLPTTKAAAIKNDPKYVSRVIEASPFTLYAVSVPAKVNFLQ